MKLDRSTCTSLVLYTLRPIESRQLASSSFVLMLVVKEGHTHVSNADTNIPIIFNIEMHIVKLARVATVVRHQHNNTIHTLNLEPQTQNSKP